MPSAMNRAFASITALLIAGFSTPATAQDTQQAEVSAGYQWLAATISGEDEWRKFSKGWYIDVAGHLTPADVTPMLSIVGQVSGNYRTFEDENFDLGVHTFMAGFRASSSGRLRGYAQFLAGGASLKASDEDDSDSETDFAMQFGGGVTLPAGARVGVRLGVDYMRIFAKEDGVVLGGNINGVRFIVGATFGLGSR
jgi:opacity protein-like surface antigen